MKVSKGDWPRRLESKTYSLSLSRRGAWGQVLIAAILITVLPALIVAWGWMCHSEGVVVPQLVIWVAGGGGVFVISLGYALLFKYPVSIVRLRRYLSTLAGGGIPDKVLFTESEDDLAAVQRYLEMIVRMAEERIRMMQKHHEVELEAQRQRVMVESIGAMCHRVGQPAAVMSICLYRLMKGAAPDEAAAVLAEFQAAFDSLTEILDKLRTTAHYYSEPYLHPSNVSAAGQEGPPPRIITD